MASDLQARLLVLLQNLQQAGLQQVSVEQLSEGVAAAEVDVSAALATFGAQLAVSDRGVRLAPDVFDLEVTGTANTQVGHINTQLNVSGPLLHLHAGGDRPVVSTGTLREALADPAVWHDLLEEQLVRQRSRAALTRILAVSSERPEYEALFHQWLRETPEIQGQLWFVKPALRHFTEALTDEAAQRRYALLRDLMDGLLGSLAAGEATALYKAFLTQLEHAPSWGHGHWNVLNAVTELFWLTPDVREVRPYRSEAHRQEAQEWVMIYLTHLADHLLREGKANTIHHFLMGLGHLVQDIRTDEMIHVIDRATQYEVLSLVLDQQAGRQLLNGLDFSRSPNDWMQSFDEEDRRLRHLHVDDVANQILRHLERQMGRSPYFYELVRRAGMKEDAAGRFVSRAFT